MKSYAIALALAAIAVIPSCPAPPLVIFIAAEVVAPIVGGVIVDVACKDNKCKRAPSPMRFEPRQDLELPPGVSQESLDQCTDSMKGVNLNVTQKNANSFQVNSLPAPCMNLATIFSGEGSHPVPCGSACLDYDNLSDAETQQVQESLAKIQA